MMGQTQSLVFDVSATPFACGRGSRGTRDGLQALQYNEGGEGRKGERGGKEGRRERRKERERGMGCLGLGPALLSSWVGDTVFK